MAAVVRFEDIKQRVLETQAKLSSASVDGREVNARLVSLLGAVERTLLDNQRKVRRSRRIGRALIVVGLAGWLAAGTLAVDKLGVLDRWQRSGGSALAGGGGEWAATQGSRGHAAPSFVAEVSSAEATARSDETAGLASGSMSASGVGPRASAIAAKQPDVDSLLAAPHDYRGRDIVVTGALVRLFNRYRLRSDDGAKTIVIDIDKIQPSARAKLEAAMAEASLLMPVLARVKGRVEPLSPAGYRLVASDLQLLDAGIRPVGLERDRQG